MVRFGTFECSSLGGKNSSGYEYGHGKSDPVTNGKKGGSIGKKGYKFIKQTKKYRYYVRKLDNKTVRFGIIEQ